MAKPKRSNGKAGGPLDARQRALHEEQEQLRNQMEQLQQFVEKAPELKKKAEERRREELISRASIDSRRIDAPTLLDRRFDAILTAPGSHVRRRSLKSERRQARLTFFALLMFLLVLAFWVWSIWR